MEKKNPVAISSEAQGCGATFKVACWASRAAMSFFSLTFFFLLNFRICVRPLRIQLCPPVCICFEFDSHSFDFYLF
jgi:hypothetical protein